MTQTVEIIICIMVGGLYGAVMFILWALKEITKAQKSILEYILNHQ